MRPDQEVGVQRGPVGQADTGDPVTAQHTIYPRPGAQFNPVGAVDVGDYGTHLGAQCPSKRRVQCLHHGYLDTPLDSRGGHLGTDEAGSHHGQPSGPGGEGVSDSRCVIPGAQRVHAVHARGVGQCPAPGASGQYQTVEWLGDTVYLQGPGGHLQAGSPASEA